MRNRLSQVFGIAAMLLCTLALHAQQSAALAALLHGRMAEVNAVLLPVVQGRPADGAAHLLLCRAAYAQQAYDAAIAECEAAATAQPQDSDTQMWLGRALGQKASQVNPLSAYKLAGRVRVAFERAVELSPANIYAASDLGEYYIGAPSFLGGGAAKTKQLAAALGQRSPARAHRLLGLLAEKNGDQGTAEREFRAAVDAGHGAEAWTDLGLYYGRHNRADDALRAVQAALAADIAHTPSQVDAASILIDLKRSPDVAETALRNYLASSRQTDAQPAFKAEVMLGNLLAARGDSAGARAAYTTAVAMAPQYAPARKALAGTR